jgi:polyribonucleotide 5'-hydroxyl-kinase
MYIGKETPMQTYLFSHYLINEKRVEAQINNAIGPRVLVVGSTATGKSTLCHIFLNYAIRLGWNPIYVDLDLSNEIALPGTIAATVIDYNLPVILSKTRMISLLITRLFFIMAITILT